MEINKTSISMEWASQEKKNQGEIQIPEKYAMHTVVFSEEGVKRFPPKREEDMEIRLEEGAPKVINSKIFNLDKDQEEFL